MYTLLRVFKVVPVKMEINAMTIIMEQIPPVKDSYAGSSLYRNVIGWENKSKALIASFIFPRFFIVNYKKL